MKVEEKILYLFNKIFSSFLKDLKSMDDELRTIIKSNYKLIDKTSNIYYNEFNEQIFIYIQELIKENYENILEKNVCKDITYNMVLNKLDDNNKVVFWNYIYILLTISWIYKIEDEANREALFDKSVKILSLIQSDDSENIRNEMEDILEDEVKDLLDLVIKTTSNVKVELDEEIKNTGEGIENMFGNSKIASLAREIAEDVDVSQLNSDNPDEMIKNLLNFNENSILTNIIQKVGSTLGDKMSKGELTQEELMGEASTMMSMLGGTNNPIMSQMASNPMFADLMKNFKNGRTQMRQDVQKSNNTKDRLRKKLEERQNKKK